LKFDDLQTKSTKHRFIFGSSISDFKLPKEKSQNSHKIKSTS
jgi:hypothetical protein